MVKSYETLVDSDTKVDVNTGIVAAGRLQSLVDSRDYDHELLVMKVQMAAICEAVKSTVPQEMWGAIVEKLERLEQHSEALDVGTDSFDDVTTIPSIRPSSSTTTTSFDLRSARRHRGRWGPLPVWPQLFGGQCGAARGGLADRQPMAEGNERHHAARTALIAIDRRSRAAIALAAYPIPPGRS